MIELGSSNNSLADGASLLSGSPKTELEHLIHCSLVNSSSSDCL